MCTIIMLQQPGEPLQILISLFLITGKSLEDINFVTHYYYLFNIHMALIIEQYLRFSVTFISTYIQFIAINSDNMTLQGGHL